MVATVIAVLSVLAALNSPHFSVLQAGRNHDRSESIREQAVPEKIQTFENDTGEATSINDAVVDDAAAAADDDNDTEALEVDKVVQDYADTAESNYSQHEQDVAVDESAPPTAMSERVEAEPNQNVEQSQEDAEEVKIEKLEFQPDKSSSKEDWDDIVSWMAAGGAEFPDVELIKYEGIADHRGVHAKRDLSPETIIMKIPKEFVLTYTMARNSPIGEVLADGLEDYFQSEQLYIAFFLLEERALGEKSWWRPYLDTLPTEFTNVPVNFNEEEIAMLEGSQTYAMWESDTAEYESDYKYICGKLPSLCEKYDFEDYKWSRLAAMTRTFSLTVHGVSQSAMMPYADMINHDGDDRIATWDYDDDSDYGYLEMVHSAKAGQALTITYGEKGNERLLSHYGFATPNNIYNEASVYLSLPDGDKLLKQKVALSGNPDTEFYRINHKFSADPAHEGVKKAMKLCRLAVASQDDLKQFEVDGAHLPLSKENEMAALMYLQVALEEYLFKFPTSIDEDEAMLKAGPVSFNVRNILLTRMGEKEVLLKLITMIDHVLAMLETVDSMKEFNRQRLHPTNKGYRSYLRELTRLFRPRL